MVTTRITNIFHGSDGVGAGRGGPCLELEAMDAVLGAGVEGGRKGGGAARASWRGRCATAGRCGGGVLDLASGEGASDLCWVASRRERLVRGGLRPRRRRWSDLLVAFDGLLLSKVALESLWASSPSSLSSAGSSLRW